MPKFMLLPVQITDAEKLVILGEVSVMLTELEKLESEKKRIPEAMKTLQGSIHLKNHALAAGVIERDVEIREEANPFSAKVQRWRVDTGEQIADRAMDPEEAQMQLGQSSVPGPTPDNVRSMAEHRELTEEQLAAATPEEAEAIRQERLALEEIERLAAEQAADAGGPKKLLKAPKGSKAKKLNLQDGEGNPLPTPEDANGVDTTPPPGLEF